MKAGGTARFEVYRAGSGGRLVPVYPRPVGVGGPRRGATYSVSDHRVFGDVYWLIEAKKNGRRITYGPIVG